MKKGEHMKYFIYIHCILVIIEIVIYFFNKLMK